MNKTKKITPQLMGNDDSVQNVEPICPCFLTATILSERAVISALLDTFKQQIKV